MQAAEKIQAADLGGVELSAVSDQKESLGEEEGSKGVTSSAAAVESMTHDGKDEGQDKESAEEDDQKDGNKPDSEMNGEEQTPAETQDWEIPYSDEEMENQQNWMPQPEEIKCLYEILAKGEALDLKWVPLPRRPLTPQHTPSPESSGDDYDEDKKEDNQSKFQPPTEFDFDEEQTLTPRNSFLQRRRTPGSSTRTTLKREARLDKVLSDMKRHRKIEEHILRTGRDLFKSDKLTLERNSQKDQEKERDSDPSTIFSPRQRRY